MHAEVNGRFRSTDTLHRAMGFYGLRGGRVAVFAVHPTEDPGLLADPRAALRREYGGPGWIVPATGTQLRLRHAASAVAGLPFTDRVIAGWLSGPSPGAGLTFLAV